MAADRTFHLVPLAQLFTTLGRNDSFEEALVLPMLASRFDLSSKNAVKAAPVGTSFTALIITSVEPTGDRLVGQIYMYPCVSDEIPNYPGPTVHPYLDFTENYIFHAGARGTGHFQLATQVHRLTRCPCYRMLGFGFKKVSEDSFELTWNSFTLNSINSDLHEDQQEFLLERLGPDRIIASPPVLEGWQRIITLLCERVLQMNCGPLEVPPPEVSSIGTLLCEVPQPEVSSAGTGWLFVVAGTLVVASGLYYLSRQPKK